MGRFPKAALTAALGLTLTQAQGQIPVPNADPYANNPDAGKLQFLLAAPAGKDSGAIDAAPASAVNQGPLDPANWKYGPAYDGTDAGIWNPVTIKMMKGEKVTGGTVFSTDTPATYCAMANAGYDFIWTEMQHDSRDWEAVGRMWKVGPYSTAWPSPVRTEYAMWSESCALNWRAPWQ